jgi:metal-responsive CopG/Arc/MetJ family transcriptional regulator
MKEGGKTNRVTVKLSDDELAAIDDFQFGSRVPNRGEAIRELVRRGLASVRVTQQQQQIQPKKKDE